MRNILFILLVLMIATTSTAHPGIGIVKDSKGNIYYTDLKHVWKISRGKKTIAVKNVHTHELYVDANDNLYGEHLWYNGERLNTWGHYVWCLQNNGRLVRVKDSSAGLLEDQSFVRDQQGNMYWAERWKISRIKKKTPGGQVSVIAQGKFKDIRWMHCTKNGILYFFDLDKLYTIDNGKLKLITGELNKPTGDFATVGARHHAFGIWTDAAGNIYVALHGAQQVKKITAAGKISTLVRSASPWSPTGGLFDNEGDLWLLEYTITGECRVREIKAYEMRQKTIL